MKLIDKQRKRKQRKFRSGLIKGNLTRLRVVLSKTNRYLIAQAINDEKGHTLIYCSTADLNEKAKESQCRKSKEWAKKLGQEMTNKLKEEKIKKIVFDRNGYPYITKKIYTKDLARGDIKLVKESSGKIHAFCEIMRQGGIEF
ncbi:50S ribosomal protein L18 [endosymbiont GvMRE of Glomus versiforme]|uniref:50S ribosomal protein L18 n=1 Tax=endosymbiont GvMRE of Glomus versiforme TaxID=2039283 RepID=UPI000EBE295A|nr:50S ribosomal protein L18 [endosymbiont GvMRE of Glomus versiforme]RHZ36245.1 50S ribosomal protein L18 [endosymbiont GvMRE of Glomus versiforme]